MAKRPRKKKALTAFAAAINFVSIAQKPGGLPYQQHTRIADGYAMATDGVVTAGHPVTTDVEAVAHTKTLKTALDKCGESFSVTYHESASLQLQSGRFRAVVPCLPAAQMLPLDASPSVASLTPALLEGLRVAAPLAVESAPRIVLASVLVGPGSLIATNGTALIEYWHGIDLPPAMVWPKAFVTALLKTGKTPVGMGYNGVSVTLHFEDRSFLKSQLYSEPWPATEHIIGGESDPWPMPDGLAAACATLAEFADDGNLYSYVGKLGSHSSETLGATVDIDGVPANLSFKTSDVLAVLPHAETVDFSRERKIHFFGPNMRAVVAKGV